MSTIHIKLQTGWSKNQTPVVARLSTPIQTGPGVSAASYTMGTRSFPGLKQLGRGVDHPPSSNAEVKGRIDLYNYFPSGSSWPVLG